MTAPLTLAQQAHADYADAKRAQSQWAAETATLAREAADAVKAARRDEETRLGAVVHAAYVAKREAENAAVKPHDLEGKRMVQTQRRQKNRYGGWGDENTYIKVIGYGVVETYRHGAELPLNLSYRLKHLATPGTAFVRLQKKDGTPGAKIAPLDDSWKPESLHTSA